MCPIKFDELVFDHIVDFTKDNTVFAAARQDDNHLRLFLVIKSTGNVYTRNGRADSWEQLFGIERDDILAKITIARNNVPVYRLNGSHNN